MPTANHYFTVFCFLSRSKNQHVQPASRYSKYLISSFNRAYQVLTLTRYLLVCWPASWLGQQVCIPQHDAWMLHTQKRKCTLSFLVSLALWHLSECNRYISGWTLAQDPSSNTHPTGITSYNLKRKVKDPLYHHFHHYAIMTDNIPIGNTKGKAGDTLGVTGTLPEHCEDRSPFFSTEDRLVLREKVCHVLTQWTQCFFV